ncbi:MAG: hypothetical protein SGCHY_003872 [Lobulomycetales sp.]
MGRRKPAEPLDASDDFYRMADHFKLWLRQEKRPFLEDLKTDKARKLFAKFAKKYNAGKLKEIYYTNLESLDSRAAHNTGHTWNLKNVDEGQLLDAVDSVASMASASQLSQQQQQRQQQQQHGASSSSKDGPTAVSSKKRKLSAVDQELQEDQRKRDSRRMQESHRSRKQAVEEELAPLATGREAKLEKRREISRGHAKMEAQKSEAPELSDAQLGLSGPGFADAIARRERAAQAKRERKEAEDQRKSDALREKGAIYREKEAKTMEMLKSLASRFN